MGFHQSFIPITDTEKMNAGLAVAIFTQEITNRQIHTNILHNSNILYRVKNYQIFFLGRPRAEKIFDDFHFLSLSLSFTLSSSRDEESVDEDS